MPHSASDVSRHKCLIYDGTPAEHLPIVVPLLAAGLKERRRGVYLGAPDMLENVRTGLSAHGVDADAEARRGALVLSADRSHLQGGGFDPDAMIAGLRRMVDEAVRDGFQGLWATGDMRWELGDDENFLRLREYEAKLELAFRELPLAGVCQYHRDSVPNSAVEDALLTHQAVLAGARLDSDNLFYIPPELLLGSDQDTRHKLNSWMWNQLRRVIEAERERDEARRALETLNRELERRVSERTADLETFSASVSHDLRAPIRHIAAFSDILSKQASRLDASGRDQLGRVIRAADRAEKLVEALQGFYKAAREEPKLEEIDLSAQALALLEELKASEPGRAVTVEVAPGLRALADGALIASVLSNLLENAWKFTSRTPQPRIAFGAETVDGARAFFVRDNGAGFDMAQAGRLFKGFSRLHEPTLFPGTGIGLATARRIVERHGGRIWAESAPGEGSTFYFTLPG